MCEVDSIIAGSGKHIKRNSKRQGENPSQVFGQFHQG